jgi:hypothetical protein
VTEGSVDAQVLFVDMFKDGIEGERTRSGYKFVGKWKSRYSQRRVDDTLNHNHSTPLIHSTQARYALAASMHGRHLDVPIISNPILQQISLLIEWRQLRWASKTVMIHAIQSQSQHSTASIVAETLGFERNPEVYSPPYLNMVLRALGRLQGARCVLVGRR